MTFFQKYGLIFMAIAIIFPSVVSISHIYAHEKIVACSETGEAHFHKKSLDCELCDLQTTSIFSFNPYNYPLYFPTVIGKVFFNNYLFLSDYQKLSFALRGPPSEFFFS